MANNTKYSKDVVNKVKELIQKDNTPIKDICKVLGIVESTFYEWTNKNSHRHKKELTEGIEQAREAFWNRTVDEIENALKKRALGYDYEEVAKKQRTNPQGDQWVEVKKTTRHVPADPKSAEMMLRRAGRYYASVVPDDSKAIDGNTIDIVLETHRRVIEELNGDK